MVAVTILYLSLMKLLIVVTFCWVTTCRELLVLGLRLHNTHRGIDKVASCLEFSLPLLSETSKFAETYWRVGMFLRPLIVQSVETSLSYSLGCALPLSNCFLIGKLMAVVRVLVKIADIQDHLVI